MVSKHKSLFWQVYISCLSVALMTLAAVSFYSLRTISQSRSLQAHEDLVARARQFAAHLSLHSMRAVPSQLDLLCKTVGRDAGIRITLIDTAGIVLGETERDPGDMGPHGDRPEVREALAAGYGSSRRYSKTLKRTMLYAAVPYVQEGVTQGVVRVSLPDLDVKRATAEYTQRMLGAALLLALVSAVIGIWVSRRIAEPIEKTAAELQRFSEGDFSQRVEVPEQQEVARLAERINEMAETLEHRRQTMREQGEESSAILAGMVEGVLAVDPDERVLRVNGAACRMLAVDPGVAEGRPIEEVVRAADFLAYVKEVLAGTASERRDVAINAEDEQIFDVNGTRLHDESGRPAGAVFVMHNVTRVRRLQKVRSEFVANVSHELKTPITSIIGFSETLLDGALDSREEAERFLQIIERQGQRMYNIVEDLLQLSRIEEDAAQGNVPRERTQLLPVLESSVQECRAKHPEAKLNIVVECRDDVTASINVPLLEQAVFNLLDNAVKYSDAGRAISLTAEINEGRLKVSVRDEGEGIAHKHLSRLFERFYRIDKARSREVGGTGLGLSIVKHIAQAHGGTVFAQSRLGQGSVFTISLPTE